MLLRRSVSPLRCLATAVVPLLMALSLILVRNFEKMLFLIPLALVLAIVPTIWWQSLTTRKRSQLWKQWFGRWPFPRSLILVSVWTLLLTLLPALVLGHFPRPIIHDEFAYLLGAETFVQGRLTNPTPPCWEHFESYHIILHPTYQSKYQPGMSLMFALGLLLTGQAYTGVILGLLLAANAMTWLLHVWLPRRWALPMSLLSVVVMVGIWAGNYFVAGPLATFASCLHLGLLLRWSRGRQEDIRWRDGFLWGISLVVLAWTRPFEGLIFSVITGIAAIVIIARQRLLLMGLARVLPGLLVTLLPAAWFQLEFNRAVTGSPTTFPYFAHDQEYFISPPFIFQELLPEPVYRHDLIRRYHHELADWHQQFRKLSPWVNIFFFRVGTAWLHYGLFLCMIPFFVLPELCRRPRTRFLFLLGIAFLLIIQLTSWFLPHYAAPVWPAWWIIIAYSIRYFRWFTWKGKPVGSFLTTLFVACMCSYVVLINLVLPVTLGIDWTKQKSQIAEQLLSQAPRHLVLVEYDAGQTAWMEWVYNSADIPRAPIIWAHRMDETHNRKLIESYPGRFVWLLKLNSQDQAHPYVLEPYSSKEDHLVQPRP